MAEKIWAFLSGKKTIVGMLMIIVADHLTSGTLGYDLLQYGGAILAGGGLLHKAQKKFTKTKGEK